MMTNDTCEPDTASAGAVTKMLLATAMLLSPFWLLPPVYLASQRFPAYNLQSFDHLDKFLFCLAAFAIISLIGLIWLFVALPRELPHISRWLARPYHWILTAKRWLLSGILVLLTLLALNIVFKLVVSGGSERTDSPPSAAAQTTPSSNALTRSASAKGRPFLMDPSGLLTPMQGRELNARLGGFQAQSGHTLVVLITPDLGGQSVEAFARARFNDWSIGRAGLDDGILVVVARREHQMRIELGRGFNALEPDARKLVNDMEQAFSQGQFYDGIKACVDALIAKTS